MEEKLFDHVKNAFNEIERGTGDEEEEKKVEENLRLFKSILYVSLLY
jgi:hypothetical protein